MLSNSGPLCAARHTLAALRVAEGAHLEECLGLPAVGVRKATRGLNHWIYIFRLNDFIQGAKERMAEIKQRLAELLGPVLGLVEKQAPNQVTGNKAKGNLKFFF